MSYLKYVLFCLLAVHLGVILCMSFMSAVYWVDYFYSINDWGVSVRAVYASLIVISFIFPVALMCRDKEAIEKLKKEVLRRSALNEAIDILNYEIRMTISRNDSSELKSICLRYLDDTIQRVESIKDK